LCDIGAGRLDVAVTTAALAGTSNNRRREVRDVFWQRVFAANTASVEGLIFTGLGHGVIAGVEVLSLLEMFGKVVCLGGDFAVEAEESLLIGGEGSNINLVLLVGVHLGLEMVVGRRSVLLDCSFASEGGVQF